MEQQKRRGLRGFVQRPVGRVLLLALGIGIVVGTMAYVSELLAIVAMLIAGLLLPIYAGLKRPRYLAISGLVILLLSAPLASIAFTQQVRTPSAVATSDPTLPSGQGPIALAVDPGTGDVYVANYAADTVTVLSPSNAVLATLAVGALPTALAVDATDHIVFVANMVSGNLSLIDTSTHRVTGSVFVGSSPTALAMDTVNDDLYVANLGSDNVSVIAGGNHTVVASVPVGTSPAALAVDTANDVVYVADRGSSSVTAIAGSNNTKVANLTVRTDPWALATNANGTELFVANQGSGDVSVLDTATEAVAATVPVMSSPEALVLGSAPEAVYVADFGAQNISVLNTSSLTVTSTIGVGLNPVALAVDAPGGRVYVADSGSSDVTVLSEATASVVATVPTHSDPTALADAANGDLYVAAYDGQAVDVVDRTTNVVTTSVSDGSGGAVLQAASVSPFVGSAAQQFTWTVTVYPQYIPQNTSAILNVTLYVSTCPGATSSSSPYCSSPYPLLTATHVFLRPLLQPTNVTFQLAVGSQNVWSWQMGLALEALSPPPALQGASGAGYVFLAGYGQGDGIEGPVTGPFSSTYLLILGPIYETTVLYLGIPFYIVLAIYLLLKRRERFRNDARRRSPGAIPPTSAETTPSAPVSGGGEPAPSAPPPATAAVAPEHERSCPQCSAVVYAGEEKCWKCGASLTDPGAAPLTSGGPG